MFGKSSDEVKVERPLKHRPGVLKMTGPDGRVRIIGDGNLYSSAELRALGMEPRSMRPPRPEPADDERAQIAAAEQRVAAAEVAMIAARAAAPHRRVTLDGVEVEPTAELAGAEDARRNAKAALSRLRRRIERAIHERDGRISVGPKARQWFRGNGIDCAAVVTTAEWEELCRRREEIENGARPRTIAERLAALEARG